MRILAAGLGCLLLTGCTSQLPEQTYQGIADRTALASICKRENLISQDQFNHYATFQMQEYPSQFSYDPAKLNNMFQARMTQVSTWELSATDRSNLDLKCAEIATVADRVSPAGNAGTYSAPSVPVYVPTTTNCLTTYGYTRCSSY
ncbi:hypothetical protein D3C75_495140 [compost metagenome]|jgi:hypothetical protein